MFILCHTLFLILEKFDIPLKARKFEFMFVVTDSFLVESFSSASSQFKSLSEYFVPHLTVSWIQEGTVSQVFLLKAKHFQFFVINWSHVEFQS